MCDEPDVYTLGSGLLILRYSNLMFAETGKKTHIESPDFLARIRWNQRLMYNIKSNKSLAVPLFHLCEWGNRSRRLTMHVFIRLLDILLHVRQDVAPVASPGLFREPRDAISIPFLPSRHVQRQQAVHCGYKAAEVLHFPAITWRYK